MANGFKSTAFVLQHPVVLALPSLIKPRKYQPQPGREQGEPKFQAVLLLKQDHPELNALYGEIVNAGKQINGAIMDNGALNPMCKWPHRDGSQYAAEPPKPGQPERKRSRDPFRGYFMFNVSTGESRPPALSVLENGVIRDLARDNTLADYVKRYFFGGALVLAKIGISPYVNGGISGVTLYMNTLLGLGQGLEVPEFAGGGDGSNEAGSQVWGGQYAGAHVGQVSPYNPITAANPADARAPYPGQPVPGPQIRM